MNEAALADRNLFVVGAGTGQKTGRIRLQTLIVIRWMAVVGQSTSILLVYFGFNYNLPIWPCLGTVAASAVLNLILVLQYKTTARLSDRGGALFLAYDLLQLSALLFMTGGLTNPFALLFLVPVTISSTILSRQSTVALAVVAVGFITLLAFLYLPLPWAGENPPHFPVLYVVGIWAALVLGVSFVATYAGRVSFETRRMSDALAETQLALSKEQRLSALGGLAAAAAHELGTPLGTITLVARELVDEIPEDSPLAEDIQLLISQSERCRDILAELSRSPDEDETFRSTNLTGLVEAAVEPYGQYGIELEVIAADGTPPTVPRSPEVMHGLANITENAVDFAEEKVQIFLEWSGPEITIRIEDDGPGIPDDVLRSLGEPYMTTRRESGGMGLGVFIATTLLERSGARVEYTNRRRLGGRIVGAAVVIRWPNGMIEGN